MPKWVIITPENQEQVFQQLEKDKYDPVLFGLTDSGYEDLSIMILQLRNHIVSQKAILNKYRDYYEKNTDTSEPSNP